MKAIIWSIVFAISFIRVYGIDYYVSPDGNDGNDGMSPDAPFATLRVANRIVQPGDTVWLRGGEYIDQAIGEVNDVMASGTPEARITYAAYPGETPVISYGTGLPSGLFLKFGQSHITIRRIVFENCERMILMKGCEHVHLEECVFRGYPDSWSTNQYIINENSRFNRITNCEFRNTGKTNDSGDDIGGLVIGNWLKYSSEYPGNSNTSDGTGPVDADDIDDTSYNLVEGCLFVGPGHHNLSIEGQYNVVRNNLFVGRGWMVNEAAGVENAGNRCIILQGRGCYRNLIENNRIAYADKPPDGNGANGIELTSRLNIVRRNLIYGCRESGISVISKWFTGNEIAQSRQEYIYHNTIFRCGVNDYGANTVDSKEIYQGGINFNTFGSGLFDPVSCRVSNNLIYDVPPEKSLFELGRGRLSDQQIVGNYVSVEDPLFVNATLGNDFESQDEPNLSLQGTSPCKDSGSWLTHYIGDNGVSDIVPVEDSGYFVDGYRGLVQADVIRTESGLRGVVISVDYEAGILQLEEAIQLISGEGIALDYRGAAPDQGASEALETDAPKTPSELRVD